MANIESYFKKSSTAPLSDWHEPKVFWPGYDDWVKSIYRWNSIAAVILAVMILVAKLTHLHQQNMGWPLIITLIVLEALLIGGIAYGATLWPSWITISLSTQRIVRSRVAGCFPYIRTCKQTWHFRDIQRITISEVTMGGKSYKQLSLYRDGVVIGALGVPSDDIITKLRQLLSGANILIPIEPSAT